MNLSQKYAQTIFHAFQEKEPQDFDAFFDKFIGLVQHKHHEKILPQILSETQRLIDTARGEEGTRLIVRDAGQVDVYTKELEKIDAFTGDIVVHEEPNIVGGYIAKNRTTMIDNSYRTRLLDLYRSIKK